MVVPNETSHLFPRSKSPHTKHLPVSINEFDVETKELGPPSCQLFKGSLLSLSHWLGRNCAVPFMLLMSAIGAGTLAVPYTFVLLSPIQAISVLCCVGLAMGYTADILVDVHVSMAIEATTTFLSPQRIGTYQRLARKAGGKLLARFTGTLTAFAVFGACVGSICVVKDMAPTMLAAVITDFYQRPLDEQQHAVVVAVWLIVLVLVLPLGCLADISTLRYSSYFGVAFSLYLVGAVAYRALVGGGEAGAEADRVDAVAPLLEHETPLFWRIAEVVGVYNFTFMLHLNVIPLLVQLEVAEMKRRQEACGENANAKAVAAVSILRYMRRTMRLYLALAVGACVLLYATFGVCAAQIYGSRTRGNILLNLSSDRIMAVPRVAILLTILLSFPLLFHPLRSLVLEMIAVCTAPKSEKKSDEEQEQTHTLSQPVQASVTVLLLSAQILCALRVPGLQVVFSFVGASILLVLCYLFPLVCYMQLAPWRSGRKERTRLICLLVLAVVAVVFCVAATLQLVVSA